MKSFEVKFKWNANAKVRKWRLTAASEEVARATATAALRKASPTAKVITVREVTA